MMRVAQFVKRSAVACLVASATWLPSSAALASDIGVSPVAVHLDKANDRATVNVFNNGTEAVVMQADMIEWRRDASDAKPDGPTSDMIVNPAVFTIEPGKSQVVRVGMRKAAQNAQEGTYRIVLREVPTPPKAGETRISGQVRVLMALRVPVYVAPINPVRNPQWQATREADGTVVASIQNDGNVHVRVGRLQLRTIDAVAGSPAEADQAVAEVVFPGEARKFRLPKTTAKAGEQFMIDVATDQGPYQVPVKLAQK